MSLHLNLFDPNEEKESARLFIVTAPLVRSVVLSAIAKYNSLVRLKNQATNGWKQIDVQLKRSHDLIPILGNTVKGYMQVGSRMTGQRIGSSPQDHNL